MGPPPGIKEEKSSSANCLSSAIAGSTTGSYTALSKVSLLIPEDADQLLKALALTNGSVSLNIALTQNLNPLCPSIESYLKAHAVQTAQCNRLRTVVPNTEKVTLYVLV